MGLPEITIDFHKKARNLIKRSSRGIVCIILLDQTKEQPVTPVKGYTDIIEADWSEKSRQYLKLVFRGEPGGVVAVRAVEVAETTETGETAEAEKKVDIKATLERIRFLSFDYLCMPAFQASYQENIKTFLEMIRKEGKKGKAVLPNFAADSSAVINVTASGISMKWDDEEDIRELTTAEFCCRIAGICAGIPLTQSTTFFVLDEVLDVAQEEDPDGKIDAGELIVVYDGEKFKIGRGVTSLQNPSELEPEDFKKIKVREGADIIRNDIYTTFNDDYVGKLNNTYDNKQAFIGAVNSYFASLAGTVLDGNEENYVDIDVEKNRQYLKEDGRDVDEMTEQQVREANTGSRLFLAGKVCLLDAMEDLDMTLEM